MNELGCSNVFCLSPFQNNSISPSDSLRTTSEKHRGSSDYSLDSKKRKVEDKDSMSRYVSSVTCNIIVFVMKCWSLRTASLLCFQDSDGDKSDDLVVDVSNEVRSLFIIKNKLYYNAWILVLVCVGFLYLMLWHVESWCLWLYNIL